jgi:hypothetical protein
MAQGRLDGCEITGQGLDGDAYAKGLEFGHDWAEGKIALVDEALQEYKKGKNPDQILSVYAGMRCGAPDDITVVPVRPGSNQLAVRFSPAEFMVNESFDLFNKLSLDDAIQQTNDLFRKSPSQDSVVLARDFNRRRLENGQLPNVYAFVGDDGRAVVRKIGDK